MKNENQPDFIDWSKVETLMLPENTELFDKYLDEIKSYSISKYGYNEKIATEYRNCGGWDEFFKDGHAPQEAVDEDMFWSAKN